MIHFRTVLATAAVSLSLAAASLTASAAPTAPPVQHTPAVQAVSTSSTSAKPVRDDKLSKSKKADISATVNIYNHAWNKKTKTLNYKKAKAYDRGRTTARREMARGIRAAGGHLSHISKAERAKVNAIKMPHKKYNPPSPLRISNSENMARRAVNCIGRNDIVTKKRTPPLFDITYYYNSCRTSSIVQGLNVCAIVAGVLAGVGAGAVGVATSIICAVGYGTTSHYQEISSIGAIWVRDHNHLLTVGAQ